ncbi:hypothetical protein BaRGS_00004004 [Batillaria attramentaria]|uniref:Uncharacterized protein n=1 Tax=Batillaria attramentaria TaxID=370345 RepID=A0ABD0M0W6_9CAEN
MLPSYMNASYMGAAPLYMNIYQHIQHLRGYPLNLTTHPPASSACVAANLIPQSSMSSPGSVGASLFPKQLPSVKSSNDANCDPAGSDAKEGSSQRSSGSRPASDTSAMKFSIDSILGLRRDNHSPSRGGEGQSQELTKTPGGAGDDDDEEESDDRKDAGSGGGDVGGKGDEDAPDSYPWLQCTRYHPPKLQSE